MRLQYFLKICKYPDEDRVYVAGIVSRGIRTTRTTNDGDVVQLSCGTFGVPGIYTKVQFYNDWIYKFMKKHENKFE